MNPPPERSLRHEDDCGIYRKDDHGTYHKDDHGIYHKDDHMIMVFTMGMMMMMAVVTTMMMVSGIHIGTVHKHHESVLWAVAWQTDQTAPGIYDTWYGIAYLVWKWLIRTRFKKKNRWQTILKYIGKREKVEKK